MTIRLPHLAAVLGLISTAPFAGAQASLPDPVAPAVIGRPLDQIVPRRPAPQHPSVPKSHRPEQAAPSKKASPTPPAASLAISPPVAQPTPALPQHVPKQALDDRADPHAVVAQDVGQGTHFGRKPLAPGAYLGSKAQALVRKYYDAHPAVLRVQHWKIGEPMPARAAVTGVPDDVRAALPRLPPGHQYVQLDGDVVLVAVQSRMVVDGISRSAR